MGSGEMTDDDQMRFDRFVDMIDSHLDSQGFDLYECPHCDGTGEDQYEEMDCIFCDGEGVLYDD
jgi:DnaJ-class molecular chaperone